MNKSKFPIVEIHGTGVHNRGAELMAIAIAERVRTQHPNAIIAVPPSFGTQKDIQRYNFVTTLSLESRTKKSLRCLVDAILSRNMINQKNVDIVLDASGFAFSDQWSMWFAKNLVKKMNKPQRITQPLILLPQALGSFKKTEIKDYSQQVFNRATYVFARDKQSYEYTADLVDNKKKLHLCPDFTLNVKPLENKEIILPSEFVAIVPNARMLDKIENSDSYLEFLKKTVELIQSKNMTPLFVVHDAHEDKQVVEKLGRPYSDIQIVQHHDPRVLKWILGQAAFVIGSRFHALVSSLSQGIPCISVGWSHKYPELFNDFNSGECLINDLDDYQKLSSLISNLSDAKLRSEKSEEVKTAAAILKEKVEKMWLNVFDEIQKLST